MIKLAIVNKILKNMVKGTVFVAIYDRGIVSKIPVKSVVIDYQQQKISLSINSLFWTQLEEGITGSQQLSIYMDKISCLFLAQVLKIDTTSQTITVSYPRDYVLGDRRTQKRIVANQSMVRFFYQYDGGIIFNKSLYDLSLGGCSLVFSASEYLKLKVGDQLSNFRLSFHGEAHYFSGSVVAIRSLSPFELEALPYAKYRLSIMFDELNEIQKIYIGHLLDQLEGLQIKKSS